MYLGPRLYGYALNCYFVYLATQGTRLLFMKKPNLLVLFICNHKKWNSHLFKQTWNRSHIPETFELPHIGQYKESRRWWFGSSWLDPPGQCSENYEFKRQNFSICYQKYNICVGLLTWKVNSTAGDLEDGTEMQSMCAKRRIVSIDVVQKILFLEDKTGIQSCLRGYPSVFVNIQFKSDLCPKTSIFQVPDHFRSTQLFFKNPICEIKFDRNAVESLHF